MKVILPLILIVSLLQGCGFREADEPEAPVLPLSGGIQVSLHLSGKGFNDTIQISDHWQLSSVGRNHGWVRKLDPFEQRDVVKALLGFSFLESTAEEEDGVDLSLIARGAGDGEATTEEVDALHRLVRKLVTDSGIAAR